MDRRVIPGAIFALCLFGVSQVSARPLSNGATPATVLLCDRVGVASVEKAKAREQVDRILQSANVQIRWLDSETCEGPPLERYFSIIIVSERPSTVSASPRALGRSVLVGTPYPRAYIFLSQVRRFDVANRTVNRPSNLGVILGHAISHELGHLLGLPHTSAGIMRGQWGRGEWTAALAGGLIFSNAEPRIARLSK